MNPQILRLLDANCNRAREALRVIEDYARFVLNDATICSELKQLRHDFVQATQKLVGEAILQRDTPGDVGTANKTEAELAREDLAHVVTAAGKRLGEALRAIEEYLKTVDPAIASRIEALRYRFYDIESRLALTLRPPACGFANVRLYVLVTESICKRPWFESAEQAILGGADCLQLREKNLDGAELLDRARKFVELCRKHRVLSIINDRPDIALLSGADGVHVGQDDLPAREVRKLLGRDKIVGVSTHEIEQARQAVLDGADYIGVGPVFRSETKPRDFLPGLVFARQVASEIRLPAVAIAGITLQNVDDVLATGIKAVAVTAAVVGCDDIAAAARALKTKLVGQTFLSVSDEVQTPVGQTFLSVSDEVQIPVGQTFLSVSDEVQTPVGQTFLSVSDEVQTPVGQTFLSVSDEVQIPVGQTFLSVSDEVQTQRRHLPHWTMAGATYFVTFRIKHGEFNLLERIKILEHLKSGDGQFYNLLAAVVMPDHAHALLEPLGGFTLSRIMKDTKGVTAKMINEMRCTSGNVWQDESFDRIMRDQNELDEKTQYIVDNPVKRNLAEDPSQYPALYVKFE